MEGNLQRVRETHKFFAPTDVQAALRLEKSENDSIHAKLLGDGNFLLHSFKFRVRVAEISGAGANHRVNGQIHLIAHRPHEFQRGSETANRTIAAQLNPVRASA